MAVVSTISLPDVVQTAFDTAAYFAFRAKNLYRQAGIDVKWDTSADPKRGNAVTFTKTNAMTAATAELPETTDITPRGIGTTQLTVTLKEYGDAVQTSEKLRATSLQDVQNLLVMHEVGASMGESIDLLVRQNGFDLATNILRPGTITSDANITATDTLTAAKVAEARAKLSGASVPTIDGIFYLSMIHPDVSYDLMGETTGRGWRDPHIYSDPDQIYTSELGAFEGIRFIESPRARVEADAGSTTTDVYTTNVWGWQAIAEAIGIEPEVRLTGPYDVLARFLNTAWYGLIGWNVFRQESIRNIKTASSIGANT